jgi:hypothetical protein
MSLPSGEEAPVQKVEQLWFTWTYDRIGEDGGGLGARAASPVLGQIRGSHYRELKLRLGYELPRGVDGLTQTPEQSPVSLAFLKQKVGTQEYQVLLNKRFTGRDDWGRAGNFFVHVLYNLPPEEFTALDAIRRWGSEFWEYDVPSEKLASDKALKPLEPGTVKDEVREGKTPEGMRPGKARPGETRPEGKTLEEHLRAAARQEWLQKALPFVIRAFLTVLAQQEQQEKGAQQGGKPQGNRPSAVPQGRRPQRVCVVAEPEQVALLILGLAESLPDVLLAQLTFSTYEREPENSTALVVGTKWKNMAGDDYLPGGTYTSATGAFLAINCVSGRMSPPLNPPPAWADSLEAFVRLAVRNVLREDQQELKDLLGAANGEREKVTDTASFLKMADYFTERVEVARFTEDDLAFVLSVPTLARVYLPKPKVREMILARRGSEGVENALLGLSANADRALAEALVGLGAELARAGQAARQGPAKEARDYLNLLTALGPAADQVRGTDVRWRQEVEWQLEAVGGWLWAAQATAGELLGFLNNRPSGRADGRPSEFALDAVVEMLLGEQAKLAQAQEVLKAIHVLSIRSTEQSDREQGGRVLVQVREGAARRITGALAPGGQEARIPHLVPLLELVAPPRNDPMLWHWLYEQQPQPVHLSWNARTWLLNCWKLIPECFQRDDLGAWLRVEWGDIGSLLSLGLPEAWEGQALQALLATQPIPAGLFSLLTQQGYADHVPVLAKLVAYAPRDPQVLEQLLRGVTFTSEQVRVLIEQHSLPLLDCLPATFVRLAEGYLAGLSETDAPRLMQAGCAPVVRLGESARQHGAGAGAPLLKALEQLGERALPKAAAALTQWAKPREAGSLSVEQVARFWLSLLEVALIFTGQTQRWLDLLKQVPQPKAEVPLSMRLFLLKWWGQALAALKAQAQQAKPREQKALQEQIQQVEQQVVPWLRIGWGQVEEVVRWNQPDAEDRRKLPDAWYGLMRSGLILRQESPLTKEDMQVLGRHAQLFESRLREMLLLPEWRKAALRFWGYVADSSYQRKVELLYSLLWMAQMDKNVAQQVLKEAEGKLEQRELEELTDRYLPQFRRPEVPRGFADWLKERVEKLPARKGKAKQALEQASQLVTEARKNLPSFPALNRLKPGQNEAVASGQSAGQPAQNAAQVQVLPTSDAPQNASEQPVGLQPQGAQPVPQSEAERWGPGSRGDEHFPAGPGMLPITLQPLSGGVAPLAPLPTPPSLGGTPASTPGGYASSPYSQPEARAGYAWSPQRQDYYRSNRPADGDLAGSAPAYVPERKAIAPPPARIAVPTPTAPHQFIKNFLTGPNLNPNYLAALVAAIEDLAPGQRDRKWPGKIAQAIGRSAATEDGLEYALVHVAPALGLRPLGLLEECARTAAKTFALDALPDHLMLYVRLAVKYAYEYGQPFEVLAGRITRVLDALNLKPASAKKESRDQSMRRLRMLHIIQNEYVKWEEEDLRQVWTWYEHTYFPASQNLPLTEMFSPPTQGSSGRAGGDVVRKLSLGYIWKKIMKHKWVWLIVGGALLVLVGSLLYLFITHHIPPPLF